MQFAKFVRCAVLAMPSLACATPRTTVAEKPYKIQIDSLRKSLGKYQDYQAALCATFTLRLWAACIIPVRK